MFELPIFFRKLANQSGQLLLEALIAIAVIVSVVMLGSQLIIASKVSNKMAGEKNVALGLIEETLEAARSVAMEKWHYVYKPPFGSGDPVTSKGPSNHYYAQTASGKWTLANGDKQETINGLVYTVYFTIDNVSRESDGDIETAYSSSRDDPSTQKISVTVNWVGAPEPLTVSEYVYRWRNLTCAQTDWGGGQSSSTTTCPATIYGATDNNLDLSGGSLKLNPLQ